ncbi:hypothetical protein [Sphingobacterium hotanense]|uniref:hypothetical protein n=1 Tax=Sphingobacterium hotanense TaxID=649196 RepID=UPI0011F120D9|nr:hypothetical protein [Sphingobacterium hotanense]
MSIAASFFSSMETVNVLKIASTSSADMALVYQILDGVNKYVIIKKYERPEELQVLMMKISYIWKEQPDPAVQ